MRFNVLCFTVILVCFTQKLVMGGPNEDMRSLVTKLSEIIKGLSDRVGNMERSVKGIQITINKHHKVQTQIIATRLLSLENKLIQTQNRTMENMGERLNEIDNEISSTKNTTIEMTRKLEVMAGITEIRDSSLQTHLNDQATLNKALEHLIIISQNKTTYAILSIVNDVQAVMNSSSHTKLDSDVIKKHMKQFDDKLEVLNSMMNRIEYNISSNFAPSVSSENMTCEIDSYQLAKLNESVSTSNDNNNILKRLLELSLENMPVCLNTSEITVESLADLKNQNKKIKDDVSELLKRATATSNEFEKIHEILEIVNNTTNGINNNDDDEEGSGFVLDYE